MSRAEEALFKMISVAVSFEIMAGCTKSAPPYFSFKQSDKEMHMVMCFATMNQSDVIIEDVDTSGMDNIGIFIRKKSVGDNLLIIKKEDYRSGPVNAFELAKIIEFKQRIDVSKYELPE
jgi:hypothetical protein